MPFKQVTEQDLKGKGVIGQPAVPGLSVTEMQKSVEQVVREAAIPAHNRLCEELEAEAAAADIGAAVPGDGDIPPETPKKLQSVLEAMLAWAKERLGLKADKADTYTKRQVDGAINERVVAIGSGDMTMAVYDPENKKKPYIPAQEAMAKAVYDPQGTGAVAQAVQAQNAAHAALAGAVQAYAPPAQEPEPEPGEETGGVAGMAARAGAGSLKALRAGGAAAPDEDAAGTPEEAVPAGEAFGGPVRLSVDEATGTVKLHAVKQGYSEEGAPVGEESIEEVPVASAQNAAALGGKAEAALSVGNSAKLGGKTLAVSVSGTTGTITFN